LIILIVNAPTWFKLMFVPSLYKLKVKNKQKREFFMKKLKLFALTAVALIGISGVANAETAMLASDDFVGISFWLVSMALLASTAFFFIERASVPAGWRVSITVAGLVTGIAFIHYMYMRDVWIITGESPTVYRYIDWLITVPLLMLEFYFVLAAVNKGNSGIFWRLLIGSVVMLVGGYLGEAGYINATLGFVIGMAGWFYILYEVFSGEAGKAASKSGNKALVTAFGAMRMIVTVGWAIYPLGYVFGYLTGGVDANSLNVIYNAADFLNKIAFGLIIWAAAMSQPGRAK
jgi:bacteriorhodopsin